MHVTLLKECRRKISPLSTKVYPKGWSGEIDDEKLAQSWIDEDKAIEVQADVKPGDFTADQTDTLRQLADQIADARTNAIDLDKLTVPELKELAEQYGVEGFADMKEAELIAALTEVANRSAVDLNRLTVPQLKQLAEQYEIEGFAGMRKAELIEALTALAEGKKGNGEGEGDES